MDKKLILAVAGAGKTTYLINKLNEIESFVVITYTINNYKSIREAVMDRFGYMPKNIKIYTYFSFLYNFCYKPFERKFDSKGLIFGEIQEKRAKSSQFTYYANKKNKKIYACRLAKLCNENIINKIIERIQRYFDYLFIDEIQDFAGNDFNFIKELERCNINILYVGDFNQHTFNTSTDRNTNKNIFKIYENYIKNLCNDNLIFDNKSLIKSRRCSKSVCDFVRSKLDIEIYSYSERDSEIKELGSEEEISKVFKNDNIVKLFYRNSKEYRGKTDNWGDSKGKTYNDICVVLNKKSYKLYKENKLNELVGISKNKFYVACTRTRNNLYFVEEDKIKKYKKLV